jgi:hypothetical protein
MAAGSDHAAGMLWQPNYLLRHMKPHIRLHCAKILGPAHEFVWWAEQRPSMMYMSSAAALKPLRDKKTRYDEIMSALYPMRGVDSSHV